MVLTAAGITGVVALVPVALTRQAPQLKDLPAPLWVLLPIQVIQNAVFIALAVGLGLWLGRWIGLGAPLLEGWLAGQKIGQRLKTIIAPSVVLGIVASILVLVLDALVFELRFPQALSQIPREPIWQRFLASFYGGVTEELFMRLGLFTLVAWLLVTVGRAPAGLPPGWILWAANIIVAVLFGLAHLPATARIFPLTAPIVIRAIVLNGLAGLAFGYLYWTRGLESAMLSHFTADIVLLIGAQVSTA